MKRELDGTELEKTLNITKMSLKGTKESIPGTSILSLLSILFAMRMINNFLHIAFHTPILICKMTF